MKLCVLNVSLQEHFKKTLTLFLGNEERGDYCVLRCLELCGAFSEPTCNPALERGRKAPLRHWGKHGVLVTFLLLL